MGHINQSLESNTKDDLNVIDIPADLKTDKIISDDTDTNSEELVLSQDDQPKNLDATQLYLGEIGFSPLLSAEEEVFFARKSLNT